MTRAFEETRAAVVEESRRQENRLLSEQLFQNKSTHGGLVSHQAEHVAPAKPFHDGNIEPDSVAFPSGTSVPADGFLRPWAGAKKPSAIFVPVLDERAQPFLRGGACGLEDGWRWAPLQDKLDRASLAVTAQEWDLKGLTDAIEELLRQKAIEEKKLADLRSKVSATEEEAEKQMGGEWRELLLRAAAVRAGEVDPEFKNWKPPKNGTKAGPK